MVLRRRPFSPPSHLSLLVMVIVVAEEEEEEKEEEVVVVVDVVARQSLEGSTPFSIATCCGEV